MNLVFVTKDEYINLYFITDDETVKSSESVSLLTKREFNCMSSTNIITKYHCDLNYDIYFRVFTKVSQIEQTLFLKGSNLDAD